MQRECVPRRRLVRCHLHGRRSTHGGRMDYREPDPGLVVLSGVADVPELPDG